MSDVVWQFSHQTSDTGTVAEVVERLLRGIGDDEVGRLFPPVAASVVPGVLRHDHHLAGEAAVRRLTEVMATAAFKPLCRAVISVDRWCREASAAHAAIVNPGILELSNTDLFAPLVSELFGVCAANRLPDVATFVDRRQRDHQAFLDSFLGRLSRDRTQWQGTRYAGPVTAIATHGAESHNGSQRVLRVCFAGGGALAYKPRPVNAEPLFLAGNSPPGETPVSVFGLLNGLPPVTGEVNLPTMDCFPGPDGGYGWQQWLEPINETTAMRKEYPLQVPRLSPDIAVKLWRRAGGLTAAAVAFGIADLVEGNVLAVNSPDGSGPAFHPVDLEVHFSQLDRLCDTGLVDGPTALTHHVGLPNRLRWCSVDGPVACLLDDTDGLRLVQRSGSWAADHSHNLVADTHGGLGYGGYLAAFLRGAFDAWTLICEHKDRILQFLDDAGPSRIRVLPRPTAEYSGALETAIFDIGELPADLSSSERSQLMRGDVPYFFIELGREPIFAIDPDAPDTVLTIDDASVHAAASPSSLTRRGEHWDLTELGVVLKGAVAHALTGSDDVPPVSIGEGVHILLEGTEHGLVSLDWPQQQCRLVYEWDDDSIALRVADPDQSVDLDAIALRLRHVDAHDAVLRERLAREDFADEAATAELTAATDEAVEWLRTVVARYGWPGEDLVGPKASAAAIRLLQHATNHGDFALSCLDLMADRVPADDRAYVTDAVLIAQQRPQRYGTKFKRHGGHLVPHPIDPAFDVDVERAAVGLPPLAEYAQRVNDHYGVSTGEEATR